MNVDLSQLKVFYVLACEKDLAKATTILGVSESTLSHSIMEFEKEVQAHLFVRDSGEIILTAQGERVYKFVKKDSKRE